MVEDAALLKAIKDYDKAGLATVFDSYAPLIYKYALRLNGDPLEADNIVGEVFAELLKQLKKGKGPRENLRSYLFQIAYHKIVDNVRDQKHLTCIDDLPMLSGGKALTADHEDKEQLIALEAILQNHLSEEQCHVILLRFIEDFNLKETAEIMGKTIDNVKVIQNRAIKKIRKVLNGQS